MTPCPACGRRHPLRAIPALLPWAAMLLPAIGLFVLGMEPRWGAMAFAALGTWLIVSSLLRWKKQGLKVYFHGGSPPSPNTPD